MGIKQQHGSRTLTGRKKRHVSVENQFAGSDKFSDVTYTQASAFFYASQIKTLPFFTHASRLIYVEGVGFAQNQPPIGGRLNNASHIRHNSPLQIAGSAAADQAVNGWHSNRGGKGGKIDFDRYAACVLSVQTRFLVKAKLAFKYRFSHLLSECKCVCQCITLMLLQIPQYLRDKTALLSRAQHRWFWRTL
jgi:hypothetical protein